MNDFSRVLQILKTRKQEEFVLATVFKIDGSSYRREGAKMLIDERGKTYGLISGGCLEEDIVHHATEILQIRKSKTLTYNLKSEDDLGWGQGAGCNGIIHVFLEVTSWNGLLDENGTSIWGLVDQKVSQGHRVVSVKFIDSQQPHHFYYSENGYVLGHWNNSGGINRDHLENFLQEGKKTKIITVENNSRIFLELFTGKDPLYIFGAGADIEPLVDMASKLDFSVRLIDPREGRCNKENFPSADLCIIDFPHTYLEGHTLPEKSFVLIMTHNFQRDKFLIHYFLENPPQYLGILGPKKRTQRLIGQNPLPETIHSPVGLNISAEGAEEIAISICAELIKVRKGHGDRDTGTGQGHGDRFTVPPRP